MIVRDLCIKINLCRCFRASLRLGFCFENLLHGYFLGWVPYMTLSRRSFRRAFMAACGGSRPLLVDVLAAPSCYHIPLSTMHFIVGIQESEDGTMQRRREF